MTFRPLFYCFLLIGPTVRSGTGLKFRRNPITSTPSYFSPNLELHRFAFTPQLSILAQHFFFYGKGKLFFQIFIRCLVMAGDYKKSTLIG